MGNLDPVKALHVGYELRCVGILIWRLPEDRQGRHGDKKTG